MRILMKPPVMVLLCLVLTLAAHPLFARETVSDPQLGLSLSVPDGFVKDPEKVQGNVVFAFQRPPGEGQKVGTFILVSRLGGVLDRKPIEPKEIAAKSPHVTIEEEKWKEFVIQAFRVPEQLDDLRMVTFNAPVPLKPRAVQIGVVGEAAREDELRGVLRSVLQNLEGQSNWLTAEQRADRYGEGITRVSRTAGVVVLVVLIGLLLALASAVWKSVRKRRK
jgi:hypothetical protein